MTRAILLDCAARTRPLGSSVGEISSQPAAVLRPRRPASAGPRPRFVASARACVAVFLALAGLAPAPSRAAPRLDVDLSVEPKLVAGADQVVRVRAWCSESLWSRAPTAAALSLWLRPAGGEPVPLGTRAADAGATSTEGEWALPFQAPAEARGAARLIVRGEAPCGEGGRREAEAELSVELVGAERLDLEVDRPQARPSETVRARARLSSASGGQPRAGLPVRYEVQDSQGAVVFSAVVETGEGGWAQVQWPLDAEPRYGAWKVTATAAGVAAVATFEVARVRLPPFFTSLDWHAAEVGGASAEAGHASLLARAWRSDGSPLRGRVWPQGRPDLELPLDPRGEARLAWPEGGPRVPRVIFADEADRQQGAQAPARRASEEPEWEVVLLPDDPHFECGVPTGVTVLARDEQGALYPTHGELELLAGPAGARWAVRGDGAAWIRVELPCGRDGTAKDVTLRARLQDDGGRVARAALSWPVASERARRGPRLWLPPLVASGDPVQAELRWPAGAGRDVQVVARRQDGAVARTLASLEPTPGADGAPRYRAAIRLPAGTYGVVEVRAEPADAAPGTPSWVVARRSTFVRPRRLAVEIEAPAQTRPGVEIQARVRVRDERGAPVRGATLAAGVVDARALALGDGPHEPDEAMAAEEVGADRGPTRWATAWFRGAASEAEQLALAGWARQLEPETVDPSVVLARDRHVAAMAERCAPVREGLAAALASRSDAWFDAVAPHRAIAALDALWRDADLDRSDLLGPWGDPLTWEDVRGLGAEDCGDELEWAVAFNGARLEHAARQVRARSNDISPRQRRERRQFDLGAPDALAAIQPRADVWGRPLRVSVRPERLEVRSAGSDGRWETEDDQWAEVRWTDGVVVRRGFHGSGTGLGSASGFGGRFAASVTCYGGTVSRPVLEVARRRFDETSLWLANEPVDGAGEAALQVPLADQVTTWRARVQATDPLGGWGVATAEWAATLPVYLDVEPPAGLSEGDEIELPVVIASALDEGGRFEIRAEVGGALELAPSAEPRAWVELSAGGLAGWPLGLRAPAAGVGRVVVELVSESGTVLDRVEREVRVDHPGALVRARHAVRAEAGLAALTLRAPPDAAPGSTSHVVTALSAAEDFALDGLESLVREPHGCFEQTSSAVYPNALVARLLAAAPAGGQHARVVQEATEACGRGYQRLLRYEVSGGGFSWFGAAPANRVLTAYGLLQFVELDAVWPVDGRVIERTAVWLEAQQGSDGRWEPDPSWLHDWSAQQGRVATTAYITWALAQARRAPKATARGLGFLRRQRAAVCADAYLSALWLGAEAATAAASAEHTSRALDCAMLALVAEQASAPGEGATLLYSRGGVRQAEIVALIADALARTGSSGALGARLARSNLVALRHERGGWGGTQATVLALRALALAPRRAPVEAVQLEVSGEGRGPLAPGVALELPDASGALRVSAPPDAEVLVQVETRHREPLRLEARAEGLEVSAHWPAEPVAKHQPFTVRLRVHNPGPDPVPLPTAIVPLPPATVVAPGASLEGLAARVEDTGAEVRLYWEALAASQTVEVELTLQTEAALDALVRPARTYAYYEPDRFGSSAPTRLRAR